ncbi:anhydro-N-acetylmuramic acid kinase [Adhaeribacter sp. BT258]|uniref:Anhydro-N-acetylmuramic acid kinase n=1 Tax=Adhaeribacter terrigena TaxID=2793070 RepID=A0ABS1C8N3_9BACT|nr:anhydro-N-acetylmuramic acid kinase [Adhaeribacter terrigena]MBK0404945.1 anhydro-N-acetylmuramic acid kinase [Adhaeribacter terrigena]
MNTFHVIGLMSGTSLDGVDLAYCRFTLDKGNWIYKILNTTTIEYPNDWIIRLTSLPTASALHFVATDQAYGKYLGQLVFAFIKANNLKPDFVVSHGHTIFHQPEKHISWQLGHGAYLAAAANLPVICDFRTLDIALNGQGAPLVPIGDELLFSEFDFCLNLGGISNISFRHQNLRMAYDISACNMLLNILANALELPYDKNGEIARSGKLDSQLLKELNAPVYFSASFPKSLGKEWVDDNSLKSILHAESSIPDKLHTACHHIAFQIAQAVKTVGKTAAKPKILVTGGGAFNTFLIELLQNYLGEGCEIVVPEPEVVSFKEALIFAFLGVLRWRNEVNCLQTVTGAEKDNVGGAVYMA